MNVFNLTERTLDYRGQKLPPNGGKFDFKDMDFIPDRDRELEKKGIIAFGSLPNWWKTEQKLKSMKAQQEQAKKETVVSPPASSPQPSFTTEEVLLPPKGNPEAIVKAFSEEPSKGQRDKKNQR